MRIVIFLCVVGLLSSVEAIRLSQEQLQSALPNVRDPSNSDHTSNEGTDKLPNVEGLSSNENQNITFADGNLQSNSINGNEESNNTLNGRMVKTNETEQMKNEQESNVHGQSNNGDTSLNNPLQLSDPAQRNATFEGKNSTDSSAQDNEMDTLEQMRIILDVLDQGGYISDSIENDLDIKMNYTNIQSDEEMKTENTDVQNKLNFSDLSKEEKQIKNVLEMLVELKEEGKVEIQQPDILNPQSISQKIIEPSISSESMAIPNSFLQKQMKIGYSYTPNQVSFGFILLIVIMYSVYKYKQVFTFMKTLVHSKSDTTLQVNQDDYSLLL